MTDIIYDNGIQSHGPARITSPIYPSRINKYGMYAAKKSGSGTSRTIFPAINGPNRLAYIGWVILSPLDEGKVVSSDNI
jgi:hypothetical protein